MEDNRAWVSADDLEALGLERATGLKSADGKQESHVEQSNRMIREATPMAAAMVIRLARYGETEQIRLKASLEILNRAQAQGATDDGREPWAGVYESVLSTQEVEDYANRTD